jgi:hypothetical protein
MSWVFVQRFLAKARKALFIWESLKKGFCPTSTEDHDLPESVHFIPDFGAERGNSVCRS